MTFRSVLRAAFAFPLLAASVYGQTTHVLPEVLASANNPDPGMASGGWLFFLRDPAPNAFRLYRPDGRLALAGALTTHRSAALDSMAVDANGEIAISWQDLKANKTCGFDLLNPSGELVRSVQTGLFEPNHIAFAPDGSLWIFGIEFTPKAKAIKPLTNYDSLRHFGVDGKLLGTFLPRSQFVAGLEPANSIWQDSHIFIGEDRIGILAANGTTARMQEWMDVGFDGEVLGTYPLPHDLNRAAMVADGRVIAQSFYPEVCLVLDRDARAWKAATLPLRERVVWGADDKHFLFLGRDESHYIVTSMEATRIEATSADAVAKN